MWGRGQPGEREFQVGERWARGGADGWSAAGFRAIHSFLVTVRSEEKSSPLSSPLLFPGERKCSVISFSFSLIMGAASFLSSSGRTDHRRTADSFRA